ncbi:hypothetical protein N7456_009703 [Penicillium angulare]|uniref:Dimeric alpha-beta barrel n=1 Tax=Penicillium angulare TaxID=116970 RepID=A0A9W9K6D8_9EURO|nr:hypothetical protein N7456_009703 [Penicillium angulare]
MSVTTSEFIFFKIKPSVRPEEPGNKEGEELQQLLNDTRHQSGHQNSAWGRSVEDENMIIWVLEWSDARSSASTDHLDRYLDPDAQPPMAVYSTLSPPVASSNTLTSNPVTEICVLSFASSLSGLETKQLHSDLINFRTSLMELPEEARPKSWSMGQVDRPSTVKHAKSPSGKAVLHLLTVGWGSVEAHKKSRETDAFVSAIAPIREKSLGALPGLDMKHVSFRKI